MTTRIKLRRDTAANWLEANPILAAGEPGLETDTGKVKYGDGETVWSLLPHAGSDTLADDGSVIITAGSTEHWVATQRRNEGNTKPRGLRYDSEGNLYTLVRSEDYDNEVYISIITKYSGAGVIIWQKSFTEREPIGLAVDSTNHAYMSVNSNDGLTFAVVKFSPSGTILWKKYYDMGLEVADAVIEEKSSTSLVIALTADDDTISDPNLGIVLEISSSDGSVLTKKTIALDPADQAIKVTGIDTDGDENVFVTGWYYDVSDDKNKMFIEKLDEDLDRVWSKSLETDTTYDMFGGDCASDAQGNIYVVGTYEVDIVDVADGGPTQAPAAILTKLNSSGIVQWTRRIGPGPCGTFFAGITATDTGDVYLSALTFVRKDTGDYTDLAAFGQVGYGRNKLIVARYDTQGTVIWQRYVDIPNFAPDTSYEDVRGQGIAVFENKFALDGFGYSSDNETFAFSSTDDDEDDSFVVQLPTDGTELTIGNLDFTESRVPGRFITHETSTSPLTNSELSASITVETSELNANAEARIANSLVKSEEYEYKFGPNGTLTIPNDGDLKLTQSQVGYLIAIGGGVNYNDDIYGRAVAVDADGNMYVAGEDDDENQPFVIKIDPHGVRVWSMIIQESTNGNGGRANGIAVHPITGHVMVVCEMYDNYTYSILVTIDQDTGRILDHEKFSDADSDVYLIDIAYNSTGSYHVLAGSKYGEFTAEQPITPQTGSTTSTIIILRSEVTGNPSAWQIGGTGFGGVFEGIANIERYTDLTGTTRQGSGATFTISDNGGGGYTVVSVDSGGTNYLPGHKIKILGSVLGGVDVTNDLELIVNNIDTGGVITQVSILGAPVSTGTGTLGTGVSGTNILVGSGFSFTFEGPRNSTDYANANSWYSIVGGSNYVESDVITIPGTALGGTSPANDLTLTVTSLSGDAVTDITPSGTAQNTTWKLGTYAAVDFSQPGSWSIVEPLDRQNLLVTADWMRTFGTASDNTDRLLSVAIDSADNIIAVGQGYGAVGGDDDDLAMVYKFNSSGTLQWARQLNETNDDCYAKSVATIGTDIYVTHESSDDGDTVITKLDSTGTVKWQRITASGDDSVIARTQDGNLLVACEAYNDDIGDEAIKIFMLTPSGETVYKRWLFGTTDDDTEFKNGRGLAVDGNSFYLTAYYDANDYDSSIAVKLPIDGSGTGEHGSFRYTDVNAMTGSFSDMGLTGINYDINELEVENGYSGELANGDDPYVNTGTTVTVGTGDFYIDGFYPDYTTEIVRDIDGGRIVFADGTTQNTSATDIPQRRYVGQRYTLGIKDRGHHILCTYSDDVIIIPYNARVEFPIGTVITIVNDTGSDVYIEGEGTSLQIMLVGEGNYSYFSLANYGVATLLKIGRDKWMISGNVQTA